MHWKPDRLTLVCHRPLDRLLDPPGAVSTQLAALGRVKAFDGLDQTDVSFRNQIQEREPKICVVIDDRIRILTSHIARQKPNMPGGNPQNPISGKSRAVDIIVIMWRALGQCYTVR